MIFVVISLFVSQILLAVDLALDCKDRQVDLWNRICRDEYMAYAVQECYYSIEKLLYALIDGEGRLWYGSFLCSFIFPNYFDYIPPNLQLNKKRREGSHQNCPLPLCRVERIYRDINSSILEGSLVITLQLKKLPVVLSRFSALTGLLVHVFNLMHCFYFLFSSYDKDNTYPLNVSFICCRSEHRLLKLWGHQISGWCSCYQFRLYFKFDNLFVSWCLNVFILYIVFSLQKFVQSFLSTSDF